MDFKEFYQVYLGEHKNKYNIFMHYSGTTLSIFLILYSILSSKYHYILPSIFIGYLFAWAGHFIFEKNKPTAFRYPLKSFLSDILLWNKVNKQIIYIFTSLFK